MTDPAASSRRAFGGTLTLAVATAALTVAAAFVMCSAFMYYDDEGYVLLSLKNFAEHGGLYHEVYSQYGPFPFVSYWLLHKLGVPITHLTGRLVTLIAWAGTAVACAALVRQITRSLIVSVAVLTTVFAYLWIMANEPAHPGGLISVLLAVAAALGHRWLAEERFSAWGWLSGAAAAALLLTKINVGGFAALSMLSWLLLHSRHDAVRRWAPAVLIAGATLVPLALMRPLLNLQWVQTYALVFSCSAIATVVAVASRSPARAGRREWGAALAGGALTTALVLGTVFARGTSPREVIEGILLAPLKQPSSFSLRYLWPAGMGTFAVASLLGCAVAWWLRRRGVRTVDPAVAILRLAATSAVAWALVSFPETSPDRLVFGFAAPCIWIWLWPLPGAVPAAIAARTWLALLCVGQFLHAFPVAGSQVAWGTFLVLPLATLSGWEAAGYLRSHFAAGTRFWPAATVIARGAVVALTLLVGARFAEVAARYRDGSDLELPGLELVRLPAQSTAVFRLLTLNAVAHADVLFSEPGMASFNLWSGIPAPTLANATHWFSLLDEHRQQAIIRALEEHPKACVIVQRGHIDFLRQHGYAPTGVLHEYIAREFTPAFSIDGFEFCVRHGRKVEPLMVGEMQVLTAAAETGAENTVFKLRMVEPGRHAIARIDLTPVNASDGGRLSFHAGNARVESLPTDLRGLPLGAPKILSWPLEVQGAVTLSIHFDRSAQPRPVAGALITLRDAGGGEIGLARLRE